MEDWVTMQRILLVDLLSIPRETVLGHYITISIDSWISSGLDGKIMELVFTTEGLFKKFQDELCPPARCAMVISYNCVAI